MRILVIDDDRSLLEALRRMLADNGHEVDCADNAQEGVERVGRAEYDVVLVDYRMPDKDGIWFMRHAKLPRRTKTLLITAWVNRDIIKTMFSLGACGYIIKPFDEAELLHHLNFHARGDRPRPPGG